MIAWAYFVLGQLCSIAAALVGYVILLPFCLAQAWETSPVPSIGQKAWLTRGPVDRWRWGPLNAVYGNPEDGVSGQAALVWGSGPDAGKLVAYWPGAPAWLRAYAWSAWRNSADQLKYAFRWTGPTGCAPFKQVRLFGRTLSFGWKLENDTYQVPIVSFK